MPHAEPDYAHLWTRLKEISLTRSQWTTRELVNLMDTLETDRRLTVRAAMLLRPQNTKQKGDQP